jgi:hypothetical protein
MALFFMVWHEKLPLCLKQPSMQLEMFRNVFLRRFAILAITLMFSISTEAQISDSVAVSNKNNRKPVSITDLQDLTKDGFNFWQDKFKGHWAGFDFGFNFLVNPDYSMSPDSESGFMEIDPLRSNSYSINFFQQSIGLQHNRNTMGLVTGAGIQFRSFRFQNNITLAKGAGGLIRPEPISAENIIKSRLSDTWIVVPLLFEFQIPIRHYANRFYFATGVYGCVRIGSHTKVKYEENGRKEIVRIPGDFSLERFNGGLVARTGYRWLSLYAMVDLTPVFKDNLGPEMNTFTVGLTLVKF